MVNCDQYDFLASSRQCWLEEKDTLHKRIEEWQTSQQNTSQKLEESRKEARKVPTQLGVLARYSSVRTLSCPDFRDDIIQFGISQSVLIVIFAGTKFSDLLLFRFQRLKFSSNKRLLQVT